MGIAFHYGNQSYYHPCQIARIPPLPVSNSSRFTQLKLSEAHDFILTKGIRRMRIDILQQQLNLIPLSGVGMRIDILNKIRAN